jgi:lipopolysaccharide/colanic/teichoic acid biosynthesis glycosyltransferase
MVKGLIIPALDILLLFGIWNWTTQIYASSRAKIYDDHLVLPLLLVFSTLWSIVVFFGGGYDQPYKPVKVIKPVLVGAAIILTVYSLLPESMRFSRALILAGMGIALMVFVAVRWILLRFSSHGAQPRDVTGILGSEQEISRVQKMFIGNNSTESVIAIASDCNSERLRDYITIHKLGRLVFCARDVSSSQIIGLMTAISDLQIEMKIAPPESLFMIGSNSIDKSGDIAIVDVNSITLPQNKRVKRLVDICFSIFSVIIWPFAFWLVKSPIQWFVNSLSVIIGKKTWVGPDVRQFGSNKMAKVYLKPAILFPSAGMSQDTLSAEALAKINTLYVKDYSPWRDLNLLFKNKSHWGNAYEKGQ